MADPKDIYPDLGPKPSGAAFAVDPAVAAQARSNLGAGPSPITPDLPVVPEVEQAAERAKREAGAGWTDYAGSSIRQGWLVPGMVASWVGSNMTPDPDFQPYQNEKAWKDVTAGIDPQFHPELLRATSGAHQLYIRDRLMEKQQDITRLGDMGMAGTIGSLALGLVAPENLALMALAGPTAALVRAGAVRAGVAKVAAASERGGVLAGAAELRAVQAADLAGQGTAKAVGVSVAANAAENAAIEAVRQSVNFEDSSAGILEAGLIGAALSAPFAIAGARSARRLSEVAGRERDILHALAARDAGTPLPDHMAAAIGEHAGHIQAYKDWLGGFREAPPGFVGPVAPERVDPRALTPGARTASGDDVKAAFRASRGQSSLSDLIESGNKKMERDIAAIKKAQEEARTPVPEVAPKAEPFQTPGVAAKTASKGDLDAAFGASKGGSKLQAFIDGTNKKMEGEVNAARDAQAFLGETPAPAAKPAPPATQKEAFDAIKGRSPFWDLIDKNQAKGHQELLKGAKTQWSLKTLAKLRKESALQGPPKPPKEKAAKPAKDAAVPKAEAPKAEAPAQVEVPAVAPVKDAAVSSQGLIGETVFWESRSGTEAGEVMGVSANGRLIIETPEGRTVSRAREDLDADSPGYLDTAPEPGVVRSARFNSEGKRELDPETAKPRDAAAVQSDQQGLDAAHQAALGTYKGSPGEAPRAVTQTDAALRELAAAVKALTGREVVFFRGGEAVLGEGAYVPSLPGKVFLSVDGSKPLFQTALHEVAHVMEKENGAVWAELVTSLTRLFKDEPDFAAKLNASNKAANLDALSAAGSRSELVANILERFHNDARFWEAVSNGPTKQGFMGRLWERLERIWNKMTGKLDGYDPEVANLVNNIAETRGALATAVRKMMLEKGEPVPEAVDQAIFRSALPSALNDEATALAKWRIDAFNTLFKSPVEGVRGLTKLLMKDAIGHSSTKAQGWTATEIKKDGMRRLGGQYHSALNTAEGEAMKIRKVSFWQGYEFKQGFEDMASRVARGDRQVLADNPDIAPQLEAAAGAQAKAYKEVIEWAKKAQVQGADMVNARDGYVNRIWNHDRIREAITKYGENDVARVLADSFRDPEIHGDVEKAKRFLGAVRKLEFSSELQDLMLAARDMHTLREELKSHLDANGQPVLGQSDINAIVDVMFAAKAQGTEADAGNTSNLKFRMDLNENYKVTMGDGKTLSVSDLFENNSRLLVDTYLSTMVGHIAMAEKGIKSKAQFTARIKALDDEWAATHSLSGDVEKFGRDKQLLMDTYANVTGRKMSMQFAWNRADRFLGAFRGYTRAAMLGQLGIPAFTEMANVVAATSMRALVQHSGGFSGLIRAFRSGHFLERGLMEDIHAMSGFGLENASSYARQNELAEFTYDRGLTRFENGANRASHAVDVMSGNNFITSNSRQLAAVAFTQKHLNVANGRMSLDDAQRLRIVHNGVDLDKIDATLADLKKYATMDAAGKLESIRWEDWKNEAPETFDAHRLLVNRSVRDAVQDHDFGEVPPWLHTTLGKVFAELKTFALAAHSKQFLKGIHYRDSQTLMTWTMSFAAQAMAYSAQTALNFAHNPAELEKRLTLDRIAKAVVQRMSVMGVMPMLFESAFFVGSGGNSFFQGGTANTDNRLAWLTPSMIQASRIQTAAKVGMGAINPFSSATATKQEVRDAFAAFPGGNLYGMRNLQDAISSQFPKKEPRQ